MAKIRPIMNPAIPTGGGKTPKSHKTHKTPSGHGPIMNPAPSGGGKTTKTHKAHKTPTRPIMNPAIPVKPSPIMNVFTGGTKGTKGSS